MAREESRAFSFCRFHQLPGPERARAVSMLARVHQLPGEGNELQFAITHGGRVIGAAEVERGYLRRLATESGTRGALSAYRSFEHRPIWHELLVQIAHAHLDLRFIQLHPGLDFKKSMRKMRQRGQLRYHWRDGRCRINLDHLRQFTPVARPLGRGSK